jgi:hypothetical protein
MIADLASEEGIFHVGNDWSRSNNQTFDSYNLVDICETLVNKKELKNDVFTRRIEITHIDGSIKAERSNTI